MSNKKVAISSKEIKLWESKGYVTIEKNEIGTILEYAHSGDRESVLKKHYLFIMRKE